MSPRTKRLRPRTYPDLRTYFSESGDTQMAFAKRLGKGQSYVSKVVNGQIEANLTDALRIIRIAHVPLESVRKAYTSAASSE